MQTKRGDNVNPPTNQHTLLLNNRPMVFQASPEIFFYNQFTFKGLSVFYTPDVCFKGFIRIYQMELFLTNCLTNKTKLQCSLPYKK